MELKWLSKKNADEVKKVWQTCFGDSREFLDEYFNSAASYSDGLAFVEDGKIVSDMFMLEFDAQLALCDYKALFLAGCATLPHARNRDLMRKLVKQALLYMREDGRVITYLHPFLHAFYRKFGYGTVAYVNRFSHSVNAAEVEHKVKIAAGLEEAPVNLLRAAYALYVNDFDNYFLRSEKRFLAWLKLLFADGGRVYYIENGKKTAYALCFEEKERADVFELVYFDEQQKNSLLNSVKGGSCDYFLPARGCAGEEFTMMRVLDPIEALRRYDYAEDVSFIIRVEDAFLQSDVNVSVNHNSLKTEACCSDGAADITVNIDELAELLSGSYAGADQLAKKLFEPKTNCYFETY